MSDHVPYADDETQLPARLGQNYCVRCAKHLTELPHSPQCTSNEAVLERADPEANAKKPALWAEHRRRYGDPLDRYKERIESGELEIQRTEHEAGSFLSFTDGTGHQAPVYEFTIPGKKPLHITDSGKILDSEMPRFSDGPPVKHGEVCELCSHQPAQYPRPHPALLIVWKINRWGLEIKARPVKDAQGHTEALQIAWIGPLVFLVPGPAWGDRESLSEQDDRLRVWSGSLGPLFQTRPWVCAPCRMSRQHDVSARTRQRWTVRRVVGRELAAFGRWLSR